MAVSTVEANADAKVDITVFEECLPYLCKLFECPVKINFITESRTEINRMPSRRFDTVPGSEHTSEYDDEERNLTIINMKTTYNQQNEISDVVFENNKHIPRELIILMTMMAHLHKYLSRICFKRCCINGYIIYELCSLVNKFSNITDVCLDDSMTTDGDYSVLLENSNIKNLSLCRCKISDDNCKEIALKIKSYPASDTLQMLNLTSNFITDTGAKYFGEALKRNRRLVYLNLSGNMIADDGAISIFEALSQFPVTNDEIIERKSQYLKFIKQFNIQPAQPIDKTSDAREEKEISSKSKHRVISELSFDKKLTFKTFFHPYDKEWVRYDGLKYYCIGNLKLAYLNLAYNNIGYIGLTRLEKLLQYQAQIVTNNNFGLLKVVIEGNPMPKQSSLYSVISQLLNDNINKQCKLGLGKRVSVVTLKKKGRNV